LQQVFQGCVNPGDSHQDRTTAPLFEHLQRNGFCCLRRCEFWRDSWLRMGHWVEAA
jgi:hypothetical protein